MALEFLPKVIDVLVPASGEVYVPVDFITGRSSDVSVIPPGSGEYSVEIVNAEGFPRFAVQGASGLGIWPWEVNFSGEHKAWVKGTPGKYRILVTFDD